MGNHHASLEDDVVIGTVQSIYRRLDKYPRDHFDLAIYDECFTGDVEILTDEGFVRFDELKDQKVAQVHDDMTIDNVEPLRKIKKHYKGAGVKFNDITLTENHNQVVIEDGGLVTYKAKDAPIDKIVSYRGKITDKSFIELDELVYCVTVPSGMIIVRKGGDIILTQNCQEAKGKQYEETINYFKPKYSVGLSGTPFRMDGKKLTDGLFDKIAYQKNIKWGIDNGYLCDVEAIRCYVDYDLSNVRTSGGDFNIVDLEEAMTGSEDAIADAFYKYSKGRPTLIFATGIKHAQAIAERIEGARYIIGDTPQEERDEIFNGFENKEIPCIVSVEVMTQGVDLPISTVGIFAKPTKSVGRYQQQVGRILRNHPDKEKALIVDCIGSSSLGLCTAPNLIGIDLSKVPEKKLDELEGDLMDMIDLAEELSDIPLSWIRNHKIVDLWAKENDYEINNVNYFQMPDGRMVVSLPEKAKIVIPTPDMLGNVDATQIEGLAKDYHEWGLETYGNTWSMQRALNAVGAFLRRNYDEQSPIWDMKIIKKWGDDPATIKQQKYIKRRLKDDAPDEELTKFEASQILNRLFTK